MHERPAGERHISELAITIKESCRFDDLPQGVETGAAGFVQARMCGFLLDRRAEHQLEEARLVECKHDIGDAQRIERGSGIGRSRSGSATEIRAVASLSIQSLQSTRNQKFADSLPEGDGFEPPVPRAINVRLRGEIRDAEVS